MKRRLTAKQERFAQLVAGGESQTGAYRLAYDDNGGADATLQENASRLSQHTDVALRVAELQGEYATAAAVSPTRVLAELAAIAFTDISDIATWDANGFTLRPSDELSPEAKRSIRDISETVTEKSRNLKIRQHSKEHALELLGKHLGMFSIRVEHSGAIVHAWDVFKDMSTEDLKALVQAGRALNEANANAIEGEARIVETDE